MEIKVFKVNRPKFTLMENINKMEIGVKTH